jgi:alkylation response protein AidB-like acyl-CoA dehydrogenase
VTLASAPTEILLTSIADLAVLLEGERPEGDRIGALTQPLMDALVECGAFSMKVPAQLGGLDLDSLSQFAVVEQLARIDGAAAWLTTTMGTSSAFTGAHLPEEGVTEVGGEGSWPLFAGSFPNSGRARRVHGGWLVDGRWGFASGIRNAAWVSAGCLAEGASDPRAPGARVYFAAPVGDVQIEDTWDASGLRATGSTHFRVSGLFVPEPRVFRMDGQPPRRGGPMHRLPTLAYLLGDHTAVSLGLARRALEELTAEARGQVRLGSSGSTATRGAFQHELGRLDIALRAARALVLDELAELWSIADRCGEVSPAVVLRSRAAAVHAAATVIDVVTYAHRMSGAAGVIGPGARRRAVADALTATQHIYVMDEGRTLADGDAAPAD